MISCTTIIFHLHFAVSYIVFVVPQFPILLGIPILEKLAPPIAPFLVGRTGKQLFLTDGKPSRPPLLLRMASDCEDGKFLYVKQAFAVTEDSFVLILLLLYFIF